VYARALAFDVQSNKIRDFDALGHLVEKGIYDKLHGRVLGSSMALEMLAPFLTLPVGFCVSGAVEVSASYRWIAVRTSKAVGSHTLR
jgi:hypothetical protein